MSRADPGARPDGPRRPLRPVVALAAITVLVVLGVTAYGVHAYLDSRGRGADAAPVAQVELAAIGDRTRVVFRSTAPGGGYGHVAVVPLTDPAGPRAVTDLVCDRVDAVPAGTSCLRATRGVVTTFEAEYVDAAWDTVRTWPLAGIPSRTRVSEDGSLIASTVFVAGHSYDTTGFSTATEIAGVEGDGYGNIESFTLVIDGRATAPADRNMWGVTFANERTFFATAASASLGGTWLVRGDLEDRTLTALRENAECPSVSPDGTRVAYKKDVGDRHWSVAVLDLATGREQVLGETRSVDDQVEWLDDDTVLYGLPRADEPGVTDVWSLSTDPGASAELFIPAAWSPSVVRP
jgi:hypothetical protein